MAQHDTQSVGACAGRKGAVDTLHARSCPGAASPGRIELRDVERLVQRALLEGREGAELERVRACAVDKGLCVAQAAEEEACAHRPARVGDAEKDARNTFSSVEFPMSHAAPCQSDVRTMAVESFRLREGFAPHCCPPMSPSTSNPSRL